MPKKKVLFVGPFPPPYGGIANHTKLLADSKLNDYYTISRLDINANYGETEKVSVGRKMDIGKGIRGFKHLRKLLKTERPDLVYMKMDGSRSAFRGWLYGKLIKLTSKAKLVVHFHGMLKPFDFPNDKANFPFIYRQRKRKRNIFLVNMIFRPFDKIIFLSEFLMNDFAPMLSKGNRAKSTFVEHFVVVDNFLPSVPSTDKVNVLFMGRLSKEKGFFDLLTAIDQVVPKFPNVCFHICGAPEDEQALANAQAAITRLEQSGHIQLHGVVKGERKQEIYAQCQFMVFPTHNEVFPNTVLEALGQGIPLVTTRVGMIPYVLEEGKNGLFFEVGNADQLAEKINQLLANPDLVATMSADNRKLALERFDIGIVVNNIRSIFDALIS